MIDLHLHTTYSDGVSETDALIREAIVFGLEAIAITDHDNTESYALAKTAAAGSALEVIPAIEINTVWPEYEKDVHILGYYIDIQDPHLRSITEKHCSARKEQMRKMADRLSQHGLAMTFEDIAGYSSTDGCLGRPHVARAIVDKGGAATIGEAFQKYNNRKSSTYVKRDTVSPHEAVEAIYESGGIPVIAHPGEMEHIEQLVTELTDYGLRGLEAYHRSHSPAIIEFHCTLAEKFGLMVTGGTDYHGPSEHYRNALSRLCTPGYVYQQLKRERDYRQQASFKVS